MLCENKFKELIPPIEKALKEAKFTKKDINEILLVGGSSKIPKIKKILKSLFGNKIIINDRINPDEIVAYIATLQAAILMKEPALEDILINEICAHSFGTDIINEKGESICDTLIKKGTNIPFEMEEEYTTAIDNQEGMSIEIYEGENFYCKDNRLLDQFILENITKAKAGIPTIMVKIKLDKDSILHITAYEKKEEKIGSIKSIDIIYDKGILSKNEIKNMFIRLKNEYFEKDIINKKEKDLCDEITFLFDEFENTNSLFDFIKIIEVQEKLVDIIDVDNIEKKFESVKYLFKLYNNLFVNYKDYQTDKKKYLKFLEKIKKYMLIFKDVDPFYLKSLIFIFKVDKYQKRFAEILYFSILLIIDKIKSGKNNNKISYYYDEILDLINDFKKKIENSHLKEKFNSIEHESKLEREKLKFKFWPQDLTIEEANSSIDQLSYIIENVTYSSNKKSRLYEKNFRAFFLTKLISLKLFYIKNNDLKNLKKYAEEALKLVKERKIKDNWTINLEDCYQSICLKIEEKETPERNSLRNELNFMNELDLNVYNDEKYIKFFEKILNENKEYIINLYKNNKKQLVRLAKRAINKLPATTNEEKNYQDMVETKFNKIIYFWQQDNLDI